MKNFTAACLLALGAAAVRLELQSQGRDGGSLNDALTQVRSDGAEFACSIADAIEQAQEERDGR